MPDNTAPDQPAPDTGPDLDPFDTPRPSPIEQIRRIRLRHQLVPFPVVGILWAGAAIAEATPPYGTPAAAGVALVTAVVWWLAWGRREHTSRRARRRYTTTIVLAGTTWLAWAATVGVAGPQTAVLWIAGYALALPWWRAHTIPIPPAFEPAPAPVADPPVAQPVAVDEPVSAWPGRWASNVARNGGPAPDSYLTDREVTDQGEAYTAQLDGRRQHVEQFIAALKPIGAALGLRDDEIALDRHPSRRLDQARLLIVDPARSPLRQLHPYPGPAACYNPDTGAALIGMHVDQAAAHWYLWRTGWGACGGVVIGATGGGKSRLFDSLITTAVYSGPVVVWVADAQGGSSLPAWTRRADWAGTESEEILAMLHAAVQVIEIRSKINTLMGRSLWTPGHAEPEILLILDECHKMFDPAYAPQDMAAPATHYAATIAREGRKVGVALVVASQYPGLPTFGNSAPMRDSLLRGNGAVFNIPSNQAQGMLPGLDISPKDIPAIPGVACLVGGTNLPFRGLYQTDEEVEALAAAAPMANIEKAVAAYLGDAYTGRHHRRTSARGALAAELAALDPDLIARITDADPELAAALANHHTRATTIRTDAPARTVHTGLTVLRLAPAPRLVLPHPSQTPTPRMTAADRIHQLIREGITTPRDLIPASGYSPAHVHNTLKALEAAGRIRNVRHGEYETAA